MNWKAKLHLAFGITLWLIPISAYLATWYYSITLFLLPLIKMYGFWNWLGMFVGLTAVGAISSACVFYMIGSIRTPRDIYKGHTS